MRRKTVSQLKAFFVTVSIGVPLCLGLAGGCTRPETAVRVLNQQGYTDVEITGWRPLMQDKNEMFSTGFRATSPHGDAVTGAVTSGLFKANTIRLD